MRNRVWEVGNDLIGYGAWGVIVWGILDLYNGLVGAGWPKLGVGAAMLILATVSEMKRSDPVAEFGQDMFTKAGGDPKDMLEDFIDEMKNGDTEDQNRG